ncbi:MAG: tRNA epoxyqueuosine(34) reductase QueG [Bdellovibrionales bacterium]
MPNPMDFVAKLNATMERFSFSHFGWTPLETPLSLQLYKDWLAAGHHGGMDYLLKHLPLKEDSTQWAPRARSAIVVAKNYFPHPYPATGKTLPLRTALYAAGEDYHLEFRRELEQLAGAFKADFTQEEFLCFTDSAPILERDLAARAGIGWVGKNSCVIHPQKGSLFFIGEILTSLDLANPKPLMQDFCGTCDRCIRACPTQAIESPRVLNANKCISYWTIEAKDAAPKALREKFGDWFFGCDICQTVCPWNEKAFGKEAMRKLSQPVMQDDGLTQDLQWILTSSNKTLSKTFASLPYSRARANGLKRNALYVIGNLRLRELLPAVEACVDDAKLKEVAEWVLQRLQ